MKEFYRVALLILIFEIWLCVFRLRLNQAPLKDGMVMNKLTSSETCTPSGCMDDEKWILIVQKNDTKEWWQVSEDYYNQVEIGNWLKKENK